MPFIAKNRETGERIDITTIEDPRTTLKSTDCVCQLCDEPMIVRAGMIRVPHFAHHTMCQSDYERHPESALHRESKRYLAQKLREEYAEYTDAAIEYEVPIPAAKRVADVLVTFPMGWREAHEIQLANITTEKLQERTDDYLRAGIDVIWWLGQNADTPANREWCQEVFGYVLVIQGDTVEVATP